MAHQVKILNRKWLTHNVLNLRIERPEGFEFSAGQAIELTIDNPAFKGDWAPFSLTGLNTEQNLELIMKVYPEHNGMTLGISHLKPGDNLLISDAWDSYRNLGPGVFIAGGTGVTPFIAILRQLRKEGRVDGSTLFFSNHTERDIFLKEEFTEMLGRNFVNILTQQVESPHLFGRIDREFLEKHITNFNQPFYLCGPGNFPEDIREHLVALGAVRELVNISY